MAISGDKLGNLMSSIGSFDGSGLAPGAAPTRGTGEYTGQVFGLGGTEVQLAGSSLVGITPELVSQFGTALTTYKTTITGYLDKMSAKEATVGFQGESINTAIKNFVARVIEVSNSYLDQLETVHNDMIKAVEANYSSQDAGLTSSVRSDAASVLGQKYNGGVN